MACLSLSSYLTGHDWPHMAKRNREDGSYATSDLFEPHPRIMNAWKYHSRADSQLTLITGKKFDPTPIENTLTASTTLVADALIFGNGKPYPGALLFRSQEAAEIPDDDFVQELAPIVERLNVESQPYCVISRSMIIPIAYFANPLEKSSKGTVLRSKAEERYVSYIDSSYDEVDAAAGRRCSDVDLPNAITEVILSVLTNKPGLTDSTDLFSFGVDPVAGTQIRYKLHQFLPSDARRLPLNIVENCGTVSNLVSHITRLRHGQAVAPVASAVHDQQYMIQLVEQYQIFEAISDGSSSSIEGYGAGKDLAETLVLAGATGALGAHVLDQCRNNAAISRVYCLVRSADAHSARQRVDEALKQRQVRPLDLTNDNEKIVVLQACLNEPKFGLDEQAYSQVAREATVIMYLAWSVNFRMKLHSFVKDSIGGVKNLINLALASPRATCPRFAFCSSVASAMAHSESLVLESIVEDPACAANLGYAQSKWAAEWMCNQANKHERLRGKISIFRVG